MSYLAIDLLLYLSSSSVSLWIFVSGLLSFLKLIFRKDSHTHETLLSCKKLSLNVTFWWEKNLHSSLLRDTYSSFSSFVIWFLSFKETILNTVANVIADFSSIEKWRYGAYPSYDKRSRRTSYHRNIHFRNCSDSHQSLSVLSVLSNLWVILSSWWSVRGSSISVIFVHSLLFIISVISHCLSFSADDGRRDVFLFNFDTATNVWFDGLRGIPLRAGVSCSWVPLKRPAVAKYRNTARQAAANTERSWPAVHHGRAASRQTSCS